MGFDEMSEKKIFLRGFDLGQIDEQKKKLVIFTIF